MNVTDSTTLFQLQPNSATPASCAPEAGPSTGLISATCCEYGIRAVRGLFSSALVTADANRAARRRLWDVDGPNTFFTTISSSFLSDSVLERQCLVA